ncbi:response regulator [Thalassolituus hydrocarboniclasticus]|uniref:Response regulator n=1 Tax=Thalassolituus hydrocarboniclasticus TaxID=2742796 RepID=A0ABY6AAN3_9GAMM|nr:response regulator [Thalassolituus hydrocarboniclasticus]UXD87024.1 response regulator [Thalassolituus hydrocarboniclasticus]
MTIKNALVVDDSKSARMMLQRLLSKINVQAEAVDSAEAALTFLESSQPDVIFMDHMMPGMDGLAATQLIKSNPRTATIPTIMYTSKEGREYQEMALSHGAHAVLAKPASHEAVMAVIQALDEPAANDEQKSQPPEITQSEVEALVQKHLRNAIAEAKAEISAGLDATTQQLQTHQTHQLDVIQARMHQQQERWQLEVNKTLTEQALFQKTRMMNQRLAVSVADKLIKKNADDLIAIMNTRQKELEATLAATRSELQKALQKTAVQAASAGAAVGALAGIAAAFFL